MTLVPPLRSTPAPAAAPAPSAASSAATPANTAAPSGPHPDTPVNPLTGRPLPRDMGRDAPRSQGGTGEPITLTNLQNILSGLNSQGRRTNSCCLFTKTQGHSSISLSFFFKCSNWQLIHYSCHTAIELNI